MNVVVVRGRLSRAPQVRELPSGDVLVAYEVTVAKADGPADTVPVVRPGGDPGGLEAGDEVVAVGRVRRRFFRAGGSTQSRTEVVAEVVVAASDRRRTRAAMARAARSLDESTSTR